MHPQHSVTLQSKLHRPQSVSGMPEGSLQPVTRPVLPWRPLMQRASTFARRWTGLPLQDSPSAADPLPRAGGDTAATPGTLPSTLPRASNHARQALWALRDRLEAGRAPTPAQAEALSAAVAAMDALRLAALRLQAAGMAAPDEVARWGRARAEVHALLTAAAGRRP